MLRCFEMAQIQCVRMIIVAVLALLSTQSPVFVAALGKVKSQNKCLASAREWMFTNRHATKREMQASCPSPVCGSLRNPSDDSTFLRRLSPQCKAIMKEYRHIDAVEADASGASVAQFGWQLTEDKPVPPIICPYGTYQRGPTNAVVVEAPDMHGFTMCTIPKSGCTNLRKLTNVMLNFPRVYDPDGKMSLARAHFMHYPTLWHYSNLTSVTPDVYPTFTVGRNPYVRLLSGYKDKMVKAFEDSRNYIGQKMNLHLGRPPRHKWRPTPEGFHRFVRALVFTDGNMADAHFGLQHSGCGEQFKFEYNLRIEDQAQWFPCWEQGLNITAYTSTGWKSSPEGSVYVGTNEGQAKFLILKSKVMKEKRERKLREQRKKKLAKKFEAARIESQKRLSPRSSAKPKVDASSTAAKRKAQRTRPVPLACPTERVLLSEGRRTKWKPDWDNMPQSVDAQEPQALEQVTTVKHDVDLQEQQLEAESDAESEAASDAAPVPPPEESFAGTECWWKPPGVSSCKEFYKQTHPGWDGEHIEDVGKFPAVPFDKDIDLEAVAGRAKDYHDTGAAKTWRNFYTQEIADLVYEMYKPDFEVFGYERETLDE